MIDQIKQDSSNQNPKQTSSSIITNFTLTEQTFQRTQSSPLPDLLKRYVKQSTSIHRERLQRTQQSNQILAKEYRSLDIDLDKVKQNKTNFNKQLDSMINMLKQVDRVQAGIMQCQRNGKKIIQMINLIQKKIASKLQKKVQNLEKLKKIKK